MGMGSLWVPEESIKDSLNAEVKKDLKRYFQLTVNSEGIWGGAGWGSTKGVLCSGMISMC